MGYIPTIYFADYDESDDAVMAYLITAGEHIQQKIEASHQAAAKRAQID